MHALLLHFENQEQEKKFLQFALPSDVRTFRTATLLGALMYAAFTLLDYFLHTEDFFKLAMIRLGVVTPTLLLASAVTRYRVQSPQSLQYIAIFTLVVAAGGNFLMANLAELVHFYLVSITVIVLFFGYTVTGVRFKYLLIFGLGILIAFQFYGVQVLHVDMVELGYEDIILFSVNLVGLFAGYIIEKNKRLQFLNQLLVENQKQEIELQNEEIWQQNEEISTQKEYIEQKHRLLDQRNRQVMSSISYAKRIQRALLPPTERIQKYLPEFFVFFRPRDVVAGDFYWFSKQGNYLFLVAADCTGHGVPGGFMTMIGNMLLNQLVDEMRYTEPEEILHLVDKKLQQTLKREQVDNKKVSDGMDMAICRINLTTRKLTFAGAKRPLWYVRDGQLHELKGDRHPIGSWGNREKKFTTETFSLASGDMIYMGSDGFADQFGGKDQSKFTTKRLKQLLTRVAALPVAEQEQQITETYQEWLGNNRQIDDVLLTGFRYVE